ncbi:MAG: hypothetical protein HY785_23125 [Oscillatoriophycideae cyanobacterium NC_groundwater_1537_Pr4_S-0.65um_50_18]|nr:hypothetical protein [Oscillatoriophycideae cyanobacterium NC_groundwater_1537_Pr4_S-0.65um_50_18]
MIGDKPKTRYPVLSGVPVQRKRNVSKAQEAIYQHLLEMVKVRSPEEVLAEFKGLFIHHTDTASAGSLTYLFEIVFSNQEAEFRNTLKRSCYILINNWEITRNFKSIQSLINLFSDSILHRPTISPTLKRLRGWLRNFIDSQDFQELKLFAARYEGCEKLHWAERYTSYLLVSQYVNLENPVEQRQAARNLSKKLKEQFKFDLAMYTARSQCSQMKSQMKRSPKNPTGLGDEVLRLIRRIVARRGFFSYPNLAHIFLSQITNLTYSEFKRSLLAYLVFSIENQEFVEQFQKHLTEKLQGLYSDHDDQTVDNALLLRTTNRLIEALTTEDHESPSPLFVRLLSSENSIALVTVLLKLILICPHARTYLEVQIAKLIRCYEKYPEEDCRWVIHFFEIFNITMTIFTENVDYNLIMMPTTASSASNNSSELSAVTYRIFSQARVGRSPNALKLLDPQLNSDIAT